ncbi:acetyl-CoA synthetase [Billgrantia endophytica]|uniref:Acetyl-CoA synthetase n=2 Tax=Billgrantia endophytica TaxID=2033802 RepID=A0A2N7U6P5_9GAMM|nr:acetyl-CoA synthetase [Halomonas endophytica]
MGEPGDQPALIGLDSERRETRISYPELDHLADGVAAGLIDRGYQPGDRIALLAANSIAQVAVLLGGMRAGVVVVPVNYRFPAEMIAYVIEDCGARLIFHDLECASCLPPAVTAVALDGDEGLSGFISAERYLPYLPGKHDPALMLYTSGSTGRPKGVLLSHASQLWVAKVRQTEGSLANERAVIAAPLYHMNALALVFLSLSSQSTTILLPRFEAALYIDAIQRYRATWLTAVPPMVAMLMNTGDILAKSDLSSVRVVRMGSAPVSAQLLEQIHELLPNARVINAYGTTEGSPVVFTQPPNEQATPPLSLGVAHPAVNIRLRNEKGELSDQGVLELKSPGLMLGYHSRSKSSAIFTEDGYYITGDVFYRNAEGFYFFVGRHDDMFNCGGENVWPGEIERLLERHDKVQQACVVPIEDDVKGYKPVAFVVPSHGAETGEEELKNFTLEHAPAYRHPRRIWTVESLPLAATNKIDRRALIDEARRRLQN